MNKFLDLHAKQKSENQKFYITNAIPYVNAKPHVGHALEFVQSDVIKRYHKLIGDETLLLCGGDENAIKNVQAAETAGIPVQEFIDQNTQLFYDLAENLHVHFDIFQKGSSEAHKKSSQELWIRCQNNGDIYKKAYEGFYCVGCELFYEPGELNENSECYEHPGKSLDKVSESNYFFKLSNYQDQILKLLEEDELKIFPKFRKNEAVAFVRQGLKDISISRSNARAKNWGVEVPGDPTQRMYVWFDALNIYQSGVGFALDEPQYKKWWPADVHVIGKGILRFHAIYWPAFLLSAKLELPKSLFVHGYFTVNGQKMSKTLGNVIDPNDLIKTYGVDALRYYFLREISPFSDGDFSKTRLKEIYNSDLANGIGNLVARVAKLAELNSVSVKSTKLEFSSFVKSALEEYRFDEALKAIWAEIKHLDTNINSWEPWENKLTQTRWEELINGVRQIAFDLQPFLPETSKKISEQFKDTEIHPSSPLFPRIS